MAEKQEILKRTYDEQAKKVAETERAYESMVRQYGETSSEAKELETQLHNERAALYDVENQLAETEAPKSPACCRTSAIAAAMSSKPSPKLAL